MISCRYGNSFTKRSNAYSRDLEVILNWETGKLFAHVATKYAQSFYSIDLLQQTITWYKIRHTGGQAHYYSRTGTLKQRPQPVKRDWPLFSPQNFLPRACSKIVKNYF